MIISIIVLLSISIGCGKDPAEAGKKGPGGGPRALMFPVETITVQEEAVTYSIYAVGSVEAFEVVQVTAAWPGGG